jgi:hypothetical protein
MPGVVYNAAGRRTAPKSRVFSVGLVSNALEIGKPAR